MATLGATRQHWRLYQCVCFAGIEYSCCDLLFKLCEAAATPRKGLLHGGEQHPWSAFHVLFLSFQILPGKVLHSSEICTFAELRRKNDHNQGGYGLPFFTVKIPSHYSEGHVFCFFVFVFLAMTQGEHQTLKDLLILHLFLVFRGFLFFVFLVTILFISKISADKLIGMTNSPTLLLHCQHINSLFSYTLFLTGIHSFYIHDIHLLLNCVFSLNIV